MSPALPRGRGTWAVAGGMTVFLLWLLTIARHGLPRRINQATLAAALVAFAVWLAPFLARLWRGEVIGRTAGRFLIAVTGLALLVQVIGLGHEIGMRYFGDEGWFLAEAQRINTERAMRPWFVYPHFLFYWDALALWAADLCGPVVPALARRLWGVEGDLNVAALVTRLASALLAALATVPVFLGARRLTRAATDDLGEEGAARAGLLAALLLALSPTMIEVGHLNLADVPDAFWSACTAFGVVLLLERETTLRYVLTGAAAGLAAASKYPAGVVAVAIAAVWIRGVVTRRRLDAGLLWAALASLAALVVAMPSILRWPEVAFVGGEGRPDILFGLRLYGKPHWHGVVRESNVLYYTKELGHAFGWPALLAGVAGAVSLPRALRRRVAWVLPFPIVHLAMLCAMALAVRRNLMPVLPFAAIVLGTGLAGAYAWCTARWRPALATSAAVAIILFPAVASAELLVRDTAPTTRDVAADWLREHLLPGAFLVQEQYTPIVGPEDLFPARRPRFAARLAPDVLRDPHHDYLLLSSEAYGRFFDTANLEDLASDETAARYRDMFDHLPLAREWTPGRFQDGPTLRLYRLDPEHPAFSAELRAGAGDAWVSSADMRGDDTPIEFKRPGDWALFKLPLEAGNYRLDVDASSRGRIRIRTREDDAQTVAAIEEGSASFTVAEPRRLFVYVELEPGNRLAELTVTRRHGAPEEPSP